MNARSYNNVVVLDPRMPVVLAHPHDTAQLVWNVVFLVIAAA